MEKKYNLVKLNKAIISGIIKVAGRKRNFFPLYIQVYVIVFLNTLNFFEYPNYNIVKWDGILKSKK